MSKRRTKASAGLGVNNRCDKGRWATQTLDSHHRLRVTQRHATVLIYIPAIHRYLWSVQVQEAGAQGVAQLQQECFLLDFEIPPLRVAELAIVCMSAMSMTLVS